MKAAGIAEATFERILITVICYLLSIILHKTSFMLLLYEKRITVSFSNER